MNLRETVKKSLPRSVLTQIQKVKKIREISKLYKFDEKRLRKYAFDIKDDYSFDNLRAKLTFHYHSIEKGLSNANIRLGFGAKAFEQLFFALNKYIDQGYPLNDIRFQTALSVIHEYIKFHHNHNFPVLTVESRFEPIQSLMSQKESMIGGYFQFTLKDIKPFSEMNFETLVHHRFSVRDYGLEKIDDQRIFDSIQLATKSPSVCNRQSWKVYFLKSPSLIKQALMIQGGLTGNGQNLQGLILVTCDKQFINGAHERNQTYVDGGLFTMSLLYALTSNNVASCALNVNFDYHRELQMRDLIKIEDSEDLIAFISVGSFPEMFKVAKSPRDDVGMFTKVL